MKVQLHPYQTAEPVPYDLLLTADPDLQKIKNYLEQGRLYLAKTTTGEVVGACVVQEIAKQEWEVLNIAIDERYQNHGLGQQIIAEIVAQMRAQEAKRLWVATANSSIGQLAFYQKCGFEMHTIVHDFFIEHYAEPIIENGIMAKHQIRLLMEL
ncbi:hypothetical protein BKI52_25375 [marine bacterium AO1-C]|nr:hypothetical protein BKI52_25375 [marine bacterium AO1-C]